ncbi:MAG: betaine/proline/choline family ABC transporter ATP-binding protein [Planctomycetes bacterium]|jgi:osmoprotectant transport system ATP-binding protein|nr:betaine/proline/choline family ABC transporter ATP-binding protein [Phycisphaerae bacterium]NBB96521.1 betaine/proline/choline family ABC transporter ATP-binding protein [Planctomycetota bacterium]
MIQLDRVTKQFGDQTVAVRELSLTIEDGETLVLLGSSGCGKTTTLKMINRLIEPTDGSILMDGEDILHQDPVAFRRRIGYVFQGIGLFPHMTVGQNINVVPRLLGWAKRRYRDRCRELLEMVDLPGDFVDRYPDELSGGQQQRVGVARALAADPKYLLMDEPFGALDAVTRDSLQQEAIKLKEKLRKTIVFVTHDVFEAITLADRIAVLHDGNLEQLGEPGEIINNPASDFVEELAAKPAQQLDAYREVT